MGARRHRRRTSVPYRRRSKGKRIVTALEAMLVLAAIGIGLVSLFLVGRERIRAFRFPSGAPGVRETHEPAEAAVSTQLFEIQLSGSSVTPPPNGEPTAVATAAEYSPPRVLIYHTHATEAYTMTAQKKYEASTDFRTEDNDRNVVAVGRLLQGILLTHGIIALHDPTNHEPPKLSSAYGRSEIAMKTYRSLYPSIELYIDVHRDAYGSESGIHDVAVIDAAEVARLMFVVGTGEGATGTGFPEMPDFESNHALATDLTEALSEIDPELTRPVRVKTGRYNQHISSACLLIEVGHNANTLEQALSSIPYLARVIADYLNKNGAAGAAAPLDGSVWVP